MTVRRTRTQKQRAQLRREAESYSWSAAETAGALSITPISPPIHPTLSSQKKSATNKLLRHEPSLIYRDLIKTLLITALIFGLLAGIAWRLNWV